MKKFIRNVLNKKIGKKFNTKYSPTGIAKLTKIGLNYVYFKVVDKKVYKTYDNTIGMEFRLSLPSNFDNLFNN